MATDLLQVVRPDGSFDRAAEPPLTSEQRLLLYRTMVQVRLFDTKMLGLQRQGRIGFYGPCTGQEASTVASAFALEARDWIFPQYREPGAAMVRGMPLTAFVHQLMGNERDLVHGRQMPCHYSWREGNYVSISSCVGTQIPLAVGAAWAAKTRGDDVVTLVYFGDGGSSTADFHVGMNFAGVFRTPTVFFCNNNQWAISVPLSRQTAQPRLAERAEAYGFEGVRVDGNDALAVYKATKEAADKARRGGGPTLIEAYTYRLGPHSSSDDPSRYRSRDEEEVWRQRDPIERMRRYLEQRDEWNDAKEQALWREVEQAIDDAVKDAERNPPPRAEELFEDVYAEVPWHLREEREEVARLAPARR